MSNSKPRATSMEVPSTNSSLGSVDVPHIQAAYCESVGSLVWLMMYTHLDISYAGGTLSNIFET